MTEWLTKPKPPHHSVSSVPPFRATRSCRKISIYSYAFLSPWPSCADSTLTPACCWVRLQECRSGFRLTFAVSYRCCYWWCCCCLHGSAERYGKRGKESTMTASSYKNKWLCLFNRLGDSGVGLGGKKSCGSWAYIIHVRILLQRRKTMGHRKANALLLLLPHSAPSTRVEGWQLTCNLH